MECKVVSKTIKYGKQHWRLNANGSWSALAFGSFGPGEVGLRYGWISVSPEKVPKEVLKILYPDGIQPEQYQDVLTIVRIIDKLFRIATNKNAFNEDTWEDIMRYALLSVTRNINKGE